MRNIIVAAAICLSLAGLSAAADSRASVRKQIHIPAQPLSTALQALARDRDLQVLYRAEVVGAMRTKEVSGELTFDEALKLLLKDTGLTSKYVDEKTVTIIVPQRDGSAADSANPSWLLGSAELLAGGQFYLAQLQADAADAQSAAKSKKAKSDEGVEEMIVEEKRVKPFSESNVDLPRTINDQQPYYILDSKTIERSGAVTVEEFLKTRLTMNTTAVTTGQDPMNTLPKGINLRGLGSDKTLILLNGRRMAGATSSGTDYQPDVNSIPLSAIERIEVLPTSASGIYGGGAIGGVVNVILKRNYSGGEVRVGYDNTWDTDSPTRRASMTFGHSLEGGKTHLMLSGQWSDTQPLLFGDRRQLLDEGLQRILTIRPSSFYSSTSPFLGSTPNITSAAYFDPIANVVIPDPGVLMLRDGRSLGVRNTTVSVGATPGSSMSVTSDMLFGNAGRWNLDFPESTQGPTGLLRPMGANPNAKSLMATVRRELGSRVEAFAEFAHQANRYDSIYNPNSSFVVPPSSASTPSINPFTTAVVVVFPFMANYPFTTDVTTRSITAGLNIQLPGEWVSGFDYSWSKNQFDYFYFSSDSTALTADIANGAINLFVDTLRYPPNFDKYLVPSYFSGMSALSSFALRASGPLMQLPSGSPTLTVGFEHRVGKMPSRANETFYPITTINNNRSTYFERQQVADSAYMELQVPLVPANAWPLLHSFDVQVSGRSERYTVDAGTPSMTVYPNNPSRLPSYGSPTLNGQPFKATAGYMSSNSTFGFKYQPLDTVTIRGSFSTAFLPPTYNQLIPNPTRSVGQVTDPRTGLLVGSIDVISGGNPSLKPQNSSSQNFGMIFEPRWMQVRGLRFNAEYYKIEQSDRIGSLGNQAIVNAENVYPDRVRRDSTGRIIGIDNSLLNLYKLSTEGWDFSLNHRLVTRVGVFNFHTAQTYILREQRQLLFTLPLLDYAGYVGEGGPAKWKGNASFGWDYRDWTVNWSTYYFGSYKQNGASGGPASLQSTTNRGGVVGSTVAAQGGETIPTQLYHDLFVGYTFESRGVAGGSKLSALSTQLLDKTTVQAGIKNIFNTIPPYDANYGGTYYISPYGDQRLRSYWISISKQF